MNQALTLQRPFGTLANHATRLQLRAVELFRTHPRESIGAGVLALIACGALGAAAQTAPGGANVSAAPPAPPPMVIRQLAPEQALQVNAEIPVDHGPNPAARPFEFKGSTTARTQALECLASAVYYEAGSQDGDGQRAVAQVVLNRVRHPAFPTNVCGVVYQGSTRVTGCQFTFTCDGSLYRQPAAGNWKQAYAIAQAALAGYVYKPVGLATHYHANYVVPYWASTLAKNAVVGAHIFYRWAGNWGRPAAFNDRYAGTEPSAAALRSAALAAEAAQPVATANQTVAQVIDAVPGAEALPLKPSMRGDKAVAIRFNLTARKAADEATHEDYTKKFDTSDNLRWSLSADTTASNEKPLGKAAPLPQGGGSATVSAQR